MTQRQRPTMTAFLAFAAFLVFGGPLYTTAFQSACRQPPSITALAAARASSTSSRGSKTATYYSNSADPPFGDHSKKASFGARMKDILLKEDQWQNRKTRSSAPSFVHEVVSLNEYKEVVADERDRLVVVRFYARWCRACKAIEPYFYRLAKSMPNVKFVQVPVEESNANLHQGLGVPFLPFAHIYSPSLGLVEELRMSKKDFSNFHNILKTYVAGECSDLEMDPETGMFLSPFKSHASETEKVEPLVAGMK